MSKAYANQQPADYVNYIRNVAIVGAGGQVGKYVTEHLLKTGKHTVTAITRADSKSVLPDGVVVKNVDYADHTSLVSALKGQDALIITMAVTAPADTSAKLIQAAIDAEVPWILPNEWGLDHDNEALARESLLGGPVLAHRKKIQESIKSDGTKGLSSYIAFINSFWYEYSLPLGEVTFGIDVANKKAILFDQGTTKINTSTFPRCGEGAANLMSLKILPESENDDRSQTLSNFANQSVYVTSFTISQEDMLNSVLRVTQDDRSNWTITHEDIKKRWQTAYDEFDGGKGPRVAFARTMYSRVFFPDGAGNYDETKGLHNSLLGLEDQNNEKTLDFYTKVALERGPTWRG